MKDNLDQYAIGWGTLALINANLAQLKGRSGFWWCVGSLIGGPVVTFLLALADPVRTESIGEG
jgi:hypothetical protein